MSWQLTRSAPHSIVRGILEGPILKGQFDLGNTGEGDGWEMTVTIPQVLQEGIYTIQQKSSGRLVDAWESDGKDFSVVTREDQSNDTQRWILTPVAGIYTIQQKSNGRFMDAWQSEGKDFSVVTREDQSNDTQRWVVNYLDGNTYTIQQVSSGRFVDAWQSEEKDFSVVTRDDQDNDTQRWILLPLGSNSYAILQKSSTRSVDAWESDGKDFSVVTRTAQINDTQRWILTPVAGIYTIQQKSNGRFMDAWQSEGKDFSVVTRDDQDNDTQRWVVKFSPAVPDPEVVDPAETEPLPKKLVFTNIEGGCGAKHWPGTDAAIPTWGVRIPKEMLDPSVKALYVHNDSARNIRVDHGLGWPFWKSATIAAGEKTDAFKDQPVTSEVYEDWIISLADLGPGEACVPMYSYGSGDDEGRPEWLKDAGLELPFISFSITTSD